jgi:hypothetical protein
MVICRRKPTAHHATFCLGNTTSLGVPPKIPDLAAGIAWKHRQPCQSLAGERAVVNSTPIAKSPSPRRHGQVQSVPSHGRLREVPANLCGGGFCHHGAALTLYVCSGPGVSRVAVWIKLLVPLQPAPRTVHSAGRFPAHGCTDSNAAEACSTPRSSNRRPTICNPTGRPSAVKPHGTFAAGFQDMLNG